ncbi:unnamed protein product [Caenorhabditis nigoni]
MPKNQQCSLADMPENVMMQILENSYFRSILTLRKVSHDLRNFIDDKKPDMKLEIVKIRIGYSRVKMVLHDLSKSKPARIKYMGKEEICEEEIPQNRKFRKAVILKSEDFLDSFFKDFQIILNLQTTKILQRFSLTVYKIPEELKKVLRTKPLKTQCFAITTSDPYEILDVISLIDSRNLKEICFYNIDDMPEEIWYFEEIVKLEQWKKPTILEIVEFYVYLEVQNFFHFTQADFRILEITVEDILELKKNYLQMPSFEFVHVEYKSLIGEIGQLGPSFSETDNQNQKWFFKIPENSEFLLEISLSPKHLYFQKIPVSNVPDGALF